METETRFMSKSYSPFHVIFGIDNKINRPQSLPASKSDDRERLFESIKVSYNGAYSQDSLLQNLRLVQKIQAHHGSIWTAKFSPTGEYLCSGGEDMKVVVWKIQDSVFGEAISSTCTSEGATADSPAPGSASTPILAATPMREYLGHTGDVVDISWSPSNFILSASADKTVRLWQISKPDCLHVFRHPDIVTAVQFHPSCDWKFVSGCFDKRVRIWEIVPDPIIRQYCAVRDVITAVCFSPEGTLVVCGLVDGEIATFDATSSRMSILSRMHCRTSGGKHKQGSKVTSVVFMNTKPLRPEKSPGLGYQENNSMTAESAQDSHLQQHKPLKSAANHSPDLLVTTNDHRIRRIRMDDRSIQCKYKGLSNSKMQIKATPSEDGAHIICGSDDGSVHVWPTVLSMQSAWHVFEFLHKAVNSSCESFPVTRCDHVSCNVAIFVPASSLIYAAGNSSSLGQRPDCANIMRQMKLCSGINVPYSTSSVSGNGLGMSVAADGNEGGAINNREAATAGADTPTTGSQAANGDTPSVDIVSIYSCLNRGILTASSDGVLRIFVKGLI